VIHGEGDKKNKEKYKIRGPLTDQEVRYAPSRFPVRVPLPSLSYTPLLIEGGGPPRDTRGGGEERRIKNIYNHYHIYIRTFIINNNINNA
jgi:hypothetical protein